MQQNLENASGETLAVNLQEQTIGEANASEETSTVNPQESVDLIAKAQEVKNYIVKNIVNNDIVNIQNKNFANIAVEYLDNPTCTNTVCLDDDSLNTLETELQIALSNKDNDAINNAITDAFNGFCPIADKLNKVEASLEGGARSESDFSMMGGDPLFLVLSEFFVSKSGKNIADIMEELNENLQGKKGKWPFGKK